MASSNGVPPASEGLQRVQEGMQTVPLEQMKAYATFSAFPPQPEVLPNQNSFRQMDQQSCLSEKLSPTFVHCQQHPQSKMAEGRSCGLPRKISLWLVPLCVLSWILAGGIGYGLRQAVLSKEKSVLPSTASANSSNINATATITVTTTQTATASAATSTSTNNLGGCPANNGTTYTSGAYEYIRLCGIDLEGLDLANTFEPSFNSCMDSCTAYNVERENNSTATKCIGVAYDIYDPTDFSKNEKCFLKYGKGTMGASSSFGITCDSALIVNGL